MIGEDPKMAEDYVVKLSHIYRYILQHIDKKYITLADGTDFIKSYIGLFNMRYDNAIVLHADDLHGDRNECILSLSLQLIIENAVKHNSITGGNPLHIRIRTEGESFLIENNYTPRSDGDKESLGMGLERIRSVYRFYTEENISISVGDGTFRCRLPLLPPEK